MTVTSTLIKIARKFELKIVIANDSDKEKLQKELDAMAAIAVESDSIQEAITKIKFSIGKLTKFVKPSAEGIAPSLSDFRVSLNKSALEGINALEIIYGRAAEMYRQELSLEQINENLQLIVFALNKLKENQGIDKWGDFRKDFLYIFDIFGAAYDTELVYGTKGHNVKVYKAVLDKIRNTVKDLKEIASHAIKAIELLKAISFASGESISFEDMDSINPKDFEIDFSISGWHEREAFVRNIGLITSEMRDYLGNIFRYGQTSIENAVWNEFIEPDPRLKELAGAVFKNPRFAGLRGKTFSSEKWNQVISENPSIRSKIEEIKMIVFEKLQAAISKKELRESGLLGSEEYSTFVETDLPMRKKIKPPAKTVDRVRYDLSDDPEKLSEFNELDFETQLKVARNELSLEDAIGNKPKITPFEEIMKPLSEPAKPLTQTQVQDLVNRMSPSLRMAWLTKVRSIASKEEKDNITGEGDIIKLIEKYNK